MKHILDHYFYYDLETSGLSPETEDVIETGLIEVKDGKIVSELTELANPGRPLSAKITEITHITDAMLVGKRTPQEVMDDVLHRFFELQIPILGHNAVRFDRLFTEKYSDKIFLPRFDRWIDTAYLFKKYRQAHVVGSNEFGLPKNLREFASATNVELANRTYQNDKVLFNLDAAVTYLGVSKIGPKGQRHRALFDCKLGYQVFEKLKTELKLNEKTW